MTQIREMTEEECKANRDKINEMFDFFMEVCGFYAVVNNEKDPFAWNSGGLTNRFKRASWILESQMWEMREKIDAWMKDDNDEYWNEMRQKIYDIMDKGLYRF